MGNKGSAPIVNINVNTQSDTTNDMSKIIAPVDTIGKVPDPVVGMEDPVVAMEDPVVAMEDPVVAMEDPEIL